MTKEREKKDYAGEEERMTRGKEGKKEMRRG